MTIYFKIECDDKIGYGKIYFDFGICPTEEVFESLKQPLGDCYKKITGFEKAEVYFCTKEEYYLNERDEIVKYEWSREEGEQE